MSFNFTSSLEEGRNTGEMDLDLLSELLLQDDAPEMTVITNGNDDTSSSSDDLSGSPHSPTPEATPEMNATDRKAARKAKRKAQVAVSARRHRFRKKHEMLDLKQQVEDLSAELQSLRAKHNLLRPNGSVIEAEEYAMAQRHKRRQAEKMNEELRRALVMQRRFFISMQSIVLNSPVPNAQLNMCTLLHTFTHLGKMAYSRQRDYLALCTDSKADLAVQILLRETEGMDFSGPPSIVTRSVPAPSDQQQIVTTTAAYAFDTMNLKNVFVSACDGIIGCGTEWPQYTAVSEYAEIKDKPRGNIRYGISGTCYQGVSSASPAWQVSVESRSVIYYRMGTDHGVLVWDFADEDDLYPVEPDTTIKRDLIGAAMFRREICSDGVERVVCRSICTKLHSFTLPPSAPELANFLQKTEDGARSCGFVVYNHIRDHAQAISV